VALIVLIFLFLHVLNSMGRCPGFPMYAVVLVLSLSLMILWLGCYCFLVLSVFIVSMVFTMLCLSWKLVANCGEHFL
jgi:hypothetical protein